MFSNDVPARFTAASRKGRSRNQLFLQSGCKSLAQVADAPGGKDEPRASEKWMLLHARIG